MARVVWRWIARLCSRWDIQQIGGWRLMSWLMVSCRMLVDDLMMKAGDWMVDDGWRWLTVDSWRIAVDGWRLMITVDGLWLVCWWLQADDSWLNSVSIAWRFMIVIRWSLRNRFTTLGNVVIQWLGWWFEYSAQQETKSDDCVETFLYHGGGINRNRASDRRLSEAVYKYYG